jgi:hypothetical protein
LTVSWSYNFWWSWAILLFFLVVKFFFFYILAIIFVFYSFNLLFYSYNLSISFTTRYTCITLYLLSLIAIHLVILLSSPLLKPSMRYLEAFGLSVFELIFGIGMLLLFLRRPHKVYFSDVLLSDILNEHHLKCMHSTLYKVNLKIRLREIRIWFFSNAIHDNIFPMKLFLTYVYFL